MLLLFACCQTVGQTEERLLNRTESSHLDDSKLTNFTASLSGKGVFTTLSESKRKLSFYKQSSVTRYTSGFNITSIFGKQDCERERDIT